MKKLTKNNRRYVNKSGGYRGWFKESHRHSLSAKGVKTKRSITANKMFRLNIPTWNENNFNKMTVSKQKGFIKDLAKKAARKVKYAIEWEKKHLPKQKEWVKKEFKKGKEEYKKLREKVRADPDAGKTRKQVDAEEVIDEIDTNDDGKPDISLKELNEVNKKIKGQLDTIDTNYDGIPDYREGDPSQISYKFETMIDKLPHSEAQKFKTKKELKSLEEEAHKTFGEKAGKLARELTEAITQKYERESQTKKLIEAYGSTRERTELQKSPNEIDPRLLSEATLKEMTVRYNEPFFTLGSYNPFKDELLRREKARQRLNEDLSKLKGELEVRMLKFKEELKKKKTEALKR